VGRDAELEGFEILLERLQRGYPEQSMLITGLRGVGVAPEGEPISRSVAIEAQRAVEAKLDESFFRVRAQRTTELELQYLRAMAELGPEEQSAGDVAAVMSRTSEQLGPTRARLIEKGLIYTTGHGRGDFTVPQFDRYMRRNYELRPPPPRSSA